MTRSAFANLSAFDEDKSLGNTSFLSLVELAETKNAGEAGIDTTASPDILADPQAEANLELTLAPVWQEPTNPRDVEAEVLRTEFSEKTAELAELKSDLTEALGALASEMSRLQALTEARVSDEIGRLCVALFPKLGRAFLAQEVVSHIQTVRPKASQRISISCGLSIEQTLRDALEQNPLLSDLCELRMQPNRGKLQVEVDWQSGGFDVDFEALMDGLIPSPGATSNQGQDE